MENERVEQETIKVEETRKQPSKSEVIGSFIGMGMVGLCFGIGLMLAVNPSGTKGGGSKTTPPRFSSVVFARGMILKRNFG